MNRTRRFTFGSACFRLLLSGFVVAVVGCRTGKTTKPPTWPKGTPVVTGPDGRPLDHVDRLTDVFIAVPQDVGRFSHVTIDLLDPKGTRIQHVRVQADAAGQVRPVPLLYDLGLDRFCARGCGFTEECANVEMTPRQALEQVAGRYQAVISSRGSEVARVPFEVGKIVRPTVFAANSSGFPKNGFYAGQETVYAYGMNFTPGGRIRVSLVDDQPTWNNGDPILDVSGAGDKLGNPTASPTCVVAGRDGTFVARLWEPHQVRGGHYDLVAEPIGNDEPCMKPGDIFDGDKGDADNDGGSGFVVQSPAVGCSNGAPLFAVPTELCADNPFFSVSSAACATSADCPAGATCSIPFGGTSGVCTGANAPALVCEHIEENVTVVPPPVASPHINIVSKDAYLPTQEIWFALEPTLRGTNLDALPGNADIYVVMDRSLDQWTDGLTLGPAGSAAAAQDVSTCASPNCVETIAFQPGCSNMNYHQISGPLPVGDYDVVVDMNQNGHYDIGTDVLDAGDAKGFYVADTTVDIVGTVRRSKGTTDDFAPNVPSASRCRDEYRSVQSCVSTSGGQGVATVNVRVEPEGTTGNLRVRVLRKQQDGTFQEVATIQPATAIPVLGPTGDNSTGGTCPQAGCPTNILTYTWNGTADVPVAGLPGSSVIGDRSFYVGEPSTCSEPEQIVPVNYPSLATAATVNPGLYLIEASLDLDPPDGTYDVTDVEVITVPQVVLFNFNRDNDQCHTEPAATTDWLFDLKIWGVDQLDAALRERIRKVAERAYCANDPDPNKRVNVRFFESTTADCATLPPDYAEPVRCIEIGGFSGADTTDMSCDGQCGSYGSTPFTSAGIWNLVPWGDLAGSGSGVFPRGLLVFSYWAGPDQGTLYHAIYDALGGVPAATAIDCGPTQAIADADCGDGICAVTALEASTFNSAPSPSAPAPYNFDPRPIYPDYGTALTREQRIYIAFRATAETTGGTTAHELGHALGHSTDADNTLRTTCGGHSADRQSPANPTGVCRPPVAGRVCANSNTDLMDKGQNRTFRERLNDPLAGTAGPQRFRILDNMPYLRAVLPYKRF
jgi:hypothetical protein